MDILHAMSGGAVKSASTFGCTLASERGCLPAGVVVEKHICPLRVQLGSSASIHLV